MFELPHDAIVIPLGDALRIANGALDEGLQASFEQLIDLIVIVIVVPYAEHALYVVPDRPSEARRVDLVVRAHRVVRQIVRGLELVIEQIADVVVEPIHQGVAVIVPGAVLDAEGRYVVQLTALKGMTMTIERKRETRGRRGKLSRGGKIARERKNLCWKGRKKTPEITKCTGIRVITASGFIISRINGWRVIVHLAIRSYFKSHGNTQCCRLL